VEAEFVVEFLFDKSAPEQGSEAKRQFVKPAHSELSAFSRQL